MVVQQTHPKIEDSNRVKVIVSPVGRQGRPGTPGVSIRFFDTLQEALDLQPRPENGVTFQVREETDPEHFGFYVFDDREPEGYRYLGERWDDEYLSQIENRIDAFEQDVEGRVQGLETRVKGVETDVSGFKAEVNQRVEDVEDIVIGIGSGEGGKAYDSLADALAQDPPIPDNVVFQTPEGIWRRDSSNPEGAVWLREIIKGIKNNFEGGKDYALSAEAGKNLNSELSALRETSIFGSPEINFGDTSSVIGNRTFIFNEPIPYNGKIKGFKIAAEGAGEIALKIFELSNGVYILKNEAIRSPLEIGINSIQIEEEIPVNKGDLIGFYTSASIFYYVREPWSMYRSTPGEIINNVSQSGLPQASNADIQFNLEYEHIVDVNKRIVVKGVDRVIIAATNASEFIKEIANAQPSGYGLISDSESEINNFLDNLVSDEHKYEVHFFGTFTTGMGFNKHPNLSFVGYSATLKMGDNLGQNYRCCIRPTNGGVPSSVSRIIDHNYTSIKGFRLIGNEVNNPTSFSAESSGIIGALVGDYYDSGSPDSVQYCINVIVEDVITEDFIRDGIIPNKGWILRNIDITRSRTDHGLYLAGFEDVVAENITFRGHFEKGALAISGNDKAYQLNIPKNARLRNLSFIECEGGPMIDVRGQFPNTLYPSTAVSINGVYIKNTSPYGWRMFSIGETIADGSFTSENYSQGISITDIYADVNLSNSMFMISRAGVKLSGVIKLRDYRPDRSLFLLAGAGDHILNALDFSGLSIEVTRSEKSEPYTIFGLNDSLDPVYGINGLNISNISIKGLTNYYLIGSFLDGGSPFVIKNLNMDNAVGTPLSIVNPRDENKISITADGIMPKHPNAI